MPDPEKSVHGKASARKSWCYEILVQGNLSAGKPSAVTTWKPQCEYLGVAGCTAILSGPEWTLVHYSDIHYTSTLVQYTQAVPNGLLCTTLIPSGLLCTSMIPSGPLCTSMIPSGLLCTLWYHYISQTLLFSKDLPLAPLHSTLVHSTVVLPLCHPFTT